MALWLCFPTFFILCQVLFLLPVLITGWPGVKLTQLALTKAGLIQLSTSNIPDFASIIIFVKMRLHFRKKNAVHPIIVQQPSLDSGAGGIWMGGNGDHPMDEANGEDQDIHNGPNVNNAEQEDTRHKAEAVMKALRRHSCLSLVDLTAAINFFFMCNQVSKIAVYFYVPGICFWIPLFVIKSSFKEMSLCCPPAPSCIDCRK